MSCKLLLRLAVTMAVLGSAIPAWAVDDEGQKPEPPSRPRPTGLAPT